METLEAAPPGPAAPVPQPKPSRKPLWIVLAIAAAASIAGLFFWPAHPAHLVQVQLEAPDGVSITVDQYSCVTPNCNVRLRPGWHELHASREGYKPQTIPLDIRADTPAPLALNVTFEPAQPKPVPAPAPEMGTLVAKTNIPGAELFIDGQKYGEAPNSSTVRVPLPAKTHLVQAVREGYTPSDSVQVSVRKASETTVNLNLTPKPSLAEIRGGVPGTQVKLDGALIGVISEGKNLTHPVSPGTHTLEFSRGGYVTKRLPRRFEPGQTSLFAGKDTELEPTPPDAAALETQDWARVSSSGNVAGLQDFLRKYPGGPHANDATKLLAGLAEAEKARLEQNDWNSVDKNDKQAVENFLAKYPAGAHSADAHNIATDLTRKEKAAQMERAEETAWNAVNRKDRASLQAFVKQFPTGKHSSEARQALANLAPAPAADTTHAADAVAVTAVLQRYAAAWNNKDIDEILALRPGLGKQFVRNALKGTRSMHMEITPNSPPKIQGGHATVVCTQRVDQTFADGVEKHPPQTMVTITLARNGNSWTILSAQ